jgi:hypothetical protein
MGISLPRLGEGIEIPRFAELTQGLMPAAPDCRMATGGGNAASRYSAAPGIVILGIVMRGRGEGSANDGTRRLSALGPALLVVGLLGGCANGSSDPETRVAAQAPPAKPEQVVQRIEPDPEPALAPAPRSAAEVSSAEVSAADKSAADKRAPVKGGSISSKHLEAELNRLEAELE